jgi:stearoyl-CoA desaturase (delta-9 desaturase)
MAPQLQDVETEQAPELSWADGLEGEGSFDAVAPAADSASLARLRGDDLLSVDESKKVRYDWPVVAWIVIVHAGALAAPFFFTWKAFGLCLFLCWLTGSLGVCLGYHRH